MPLENATYISDLQPDWPEGSDPESAGDDHLRMMKQTIKNTFPNIDAPVTTDPTTLNNITDGVAWVDNSATAGAPSYFNVTEPASERATLALLSVATPTADFAKQNPNLALTFEILQNLIYPVGSVIINVGADPATYLGFGTWEARSGALYGAGAVEDATGNNQSFPAHGSVAGYWRVHGSHVVPFEATGATTSNSGHSHPVPSGGKLHGQGYQTENEDYAGPGAQTTGSENAHTHDVKVTVGTDTANFFAPGYSLSVWERTA